VEFAGGFGSSLALSVVDFTALRDLLTY
jgi:hypothetical protein